MPRSVQDLIKGKSTEDACIFAHQVSSLSVTKYDTIPSYHSIEEVKSIFNQ